jgi:hypothetical protein
MNPKLRICTGELKQPKFFCDKYRIVNNKRVCKHLESFTGKGKFVCKKRAKVVKVTKVHTIKVTKKHFVKPIAKKGFTIKRGVVKSCGCVYYVYEKTGRKLCYVAAPKKVEHTVTHTKKRTVSHFEEKHTTYKVIHTHHQIVNVSVSGYSKALFQNINLFFGIDRRMLEMCKKL